jgi:predicted negative regulator of RcsB-dependent stress response
MVYSRWGDYYLKINDKTNAIKSYRKALELDPNDQQTKDILETLKK